MNSATRSVAIVCAAATLAALPCRAEAPGMLLAKFGFEKPDALGVWHEELKPAQEPSELMIDSANPHSGTGALKFRVKADIDGQRDVFTGVPLAAADGTTGRRVRFRFWARTGGAATGDVSVRVLERGANGVLGWLGNKAEAILIDKGAAWAEYSVESPLRDDAKMLTVELTVAHAAANRTAWIDDLSVEQIAGNAK